MRRFFNGLVLGIVLGAVGFWFAQRKMQQHPEAAQRYQNAAAQAQASAGDTASHVSDAVKAKMDALDLHSDGIKDELARTGKVVRRKAGELGQQVLDAAADARTVAAIKSSYAVDRDLSVWKISVSCTQGHVTLAGTVSAPEDVGRAVALALDAPGAVDVDSSIQVKPNS